MKCNGAEVIGSELGGIFESRLVGDGVRAVRQLVSLHAAYVADGTVMLEAWLRHYLHVS